MPNWCYSNVKIIGSSTNNLYPLIKMWTSKNYVENGFGTNWLGNIVGNSGIDTCTADTNFTVSCRGFISDLYYNDGVISFTQETAWNPMFGLWFKIFDKYNLDCDIIYTAEEPGNGIFLTNDDDYIDEYYLDIWESIDEYPYIIYNDCTDSETMKEICIDLLDLKNIQYDSSNLTDMIEKTNESYYDNLAIHQWKYCAATDF